jgi:branched-chain amino acid transport system permease protein
MQDIIYILQIVANGLSIGLIYVLMAVGFSLIFGIMGIFNFTHGELYMLGAFGIYFRSGKLGLPYFLAVMTTMLIVGVLGVLLERVFFRPVYGQMFPSFMIALGLNMMIGTAALVCFGDQDRSVPKVVSGVVKLAGVRLSKEMVLGMLISGIAVAGLIWFVHHTKAGRAIRATAQNSDAASLQGIKIRRIYMQTFGISAALAGIAGAIIAPVYFINPLIGGPAMFKCIVVVILGGLGSIPGAIAGGLALGFIESVGLTFVGNSAHMIGWIIVIVLLLFRPQGLLGKQ